MIVLCKDMQRLLYPLQFVETCRKRWHTANPSLTIKLFWLPVMPDKRCILMHAVLGFSPSPWCTTLNYFQFSSVKCWSVRSKYHYEKKYAGFGSKQPGNSVKSNRTQAKLWQQAIHPQQLCTFSENIFPWHSVTQINTSTSSYHSQIIPKSNLLNVLFFPSLNIVQFAVIFSKLCLDFCSFKYSPPKTLHSVREIFAIRPVIAELNATAFQSQYCTS